MAALDGNAIAGTLVAVFDTELTTAIGACASCGRRSLVWWVSSPSSCAGREPSSCADTAPAW